MPAGPRLIVIEPNGTRRAVIVTTSPFRIGRQAGNELTLRDGRVERAVTILRFFETRAVRSDLESGC